MKIETKVLASPMEWGPSGWKFLHCIASTYPLHPTKTQQREYYRFFRSLGPVLPCQLCRPHYERYLQIHSIFPALQSRRHLCEYLFRFHNHVNRRLGKRVLSKKELPCYFETPSDI